jgi:hypothetical protein
MNSSKQADYFDFSNVRKEGRFIGEFDNKSSGKNWENREFIDLVMRHGICG